MASETEMLTEEEFASLLLVGNVPVNGRAKESERQLRRPYS
jgi:hypothetical protein